MPAKLWVPALQRFWFIASVGLTALIVVRWLRTRRQLQERLFADAPGSARDNVPVEPAWLDRWLFEAGIRSPQAAGIFMGLTLLLGLAGLAAVFAFRIPLSMAGLAKFMGRLPGGVGEVLSPLIFAAPWLLVAPAGFRSRRCTSALAAAGACGKWKRTCPSSWNYCPRWPKLAWDLMRPSIAFWLRCRPVAAFWPKRHFASSPARHPGRA